MYKRFHLIAAAAILSVASFGILTSVLSTTSAQTNRNPQPSGQALEIAPPVITLSADPGKTVTTQVHLRNVSSGSLVVTGQANDFVASDEIGTPKIILEEDNSNPYSLKDWITPPARLVLAPREMRTMNITINVPANASPGGHYGVIRFTATPPQLEGSGVSLSASLGSLILLTVSGPVDEKLAVEEFSINKDGKKGSVFQSGPLNFVVRLKNNGNVHQQPVGRIIIKDMFGRDTASLNVNVPPRNILPQSIRKFESPLDSTVIGDKRLFGRYSAELTVTYGQNEQKISSKQNFWVVPYKLVGIIVAALIIGFILIRLGIRRYNRYIIKKSK